MISSELYDAIGFFTEEKRIMPCMAVACGVEKPFSGKPVRGVLEDEPDGRRDAFYAFRGQIRDGVAAGPDTLFDLASVTKLFTGLTLMKLIENGRLDPDRELTAYAPEFPGLRGIPVSRVMGFQVPLQTPGRVDEQPDRARALRCLRQVTVAEKRPLRDYSDMHAMLLKYVAEHICGKPFYEIIRESILEPLGMRETFAAVPAERKEHCALYDREHRIIGETYQLREGLPQGSPHDPKARLLSPWGEDLCGHAGLFSTLNDLSRFCRGVLAGRVVSRESLRRMAENRTGARRADGTWSQFLGLQCYVRHPDQYYSEVPCYMTRQAIAIGGFTGNHVSMDPETGAWAVFLGNRVQNRLTMLTPSPGKSFADYGLAEDGTGSVCWPDGTVVLSSVNYVHHKDRQLHEPIRRLLGLREIAFEEA